METLDYRRVPTGAGIGPQFPRPWYSSAARFGRRPAEALAAIWIVSAVAVGDQLGMRAHAFHWRIIWLAIALLPLLATIIQTRWSSLGLSRSQLHRLVPASDSPAAHEAAAHEPERRLLLFGMPKH